MRYLAVTCMMLASFSAAVAQMTHEETVVRTAYAKFAYASQQYAMVQLATESMGTVVGLPPKKTGTTNDQRMAAAQVSFALSDFVIGNVQDIINLKAVDFISPASGEMLAAAQGDSQFAEGGTMFEARSIQPQWRPVSPPSPEVLEVRLADLYQIQWHLERPASLWQRYASYSVTVTFQGKSHGPYKALFIFGHDANGNEVIHPEDGTTDARGLAFAMHEHLFPDVLLRTRLRSSPVVANWLNANQMSAPSCSVGQADVCCDLAKLQCGPGREDAAEAIAKPLPVRESHN
jgi:hypothetical protein